MRLPPLTGLKVLEFAGLAPGPFAGMVLADFGANVIRVDRMVSGTSDVLARGKRSIAVNMRSPQGKTIVMALANKADVIIDPFRPGVLERLGFDPAKILQSNPKCIIARLTGYGQTGQYAKMAGHDINYIAISGALSVLGRGNENPMFPANILGDFAGGGLMAVVGVLMALIERQKSGRGQVIDVAMIDGAAYLSTFVGKLKGNGLWNEPKGKNMFDGGAPFYETYKTKDAKYLSVGAIEPQFYVLLLKGMGLEAAQLPDQLDTSEWPKLKQIFSETFAKKTRDEWMKVFDGTDACVAPVLEWEEVLDLQHNKERHMFMQAASETSDLAPAPAPRLYETPHVFAKSGRIIARDPDVGEHTVEVLLELGLTQQHIQEAVDNGVIQVASKGQAKL